MKTIEQMIADVNNFSPICNTFFRKVCQAGLWERIDEIDQRGMSAAFGHTELRTYVTAGRTMITIAGDDDQITFITDDRERKNIGLHTTEGDPDKIILMVTAVIQDWPKTADEQRNVFKANSNIRIG